MPGAAVIDRAVEQDLKRLINDVDVVFAMTEHVSELEEKLRGQYQQAGSPNGENYDGFLRWTDELRGDQGSALGPRLKMIGQFHAAWQGTGEGYSGSSRGGGQTQPVGGGNTA